MVLKIKRCIQALGCLMDSLPPIFYVKTGKDKLTKIDIFRKEL